jgi:hypothetical protein
MATKQENQFKEQTEEVPVLFGLLGTKHVHTITDRETGDITTASSYETPKAARDEAWDKKFDKDKAE